MAYHYRHQSSETVLLPLYAAAAAISEGQIIQFGTTADQDKGVYMVIAGAGSAVPLDVVGIVSNNRTAADRTDADPDGGASATFGTLEPVALVKPGDLVCIEYADTSQIDVASYSAPTVTITSLQDAFDGGWVYVAQDVSTETGIGQLGYCEASAAGSVGLRDNFTTALDSTSDVVMILPIGSLVVASSAGGIRLNTYAASTNYVTKFAVIKNEFTYLGKNGWELMQPQLHSNLQLNGLAPKFRAVGCLRDLAAASID